MFKYRGHLPLLFLLGGIFVFSLQKINSGGFEKYISYETYELICLLVCFIGFTIRAYTVGHTPKNTSGRNVDSQVADELNTTGIYSLVRHPLYVGNFFMWLGVVMLAQSIWFLFVFVLFYWIYYERIMYAEEQFLRRKFGELYKEWGNVTPAFIFSFKNYRPNKMAFSWKKVIKKEKNGFAAIFVVFLLFRTVGDYIDKKTFVTDSWLFYVTIGSAVLYFILKFIKKYTSLLDEEGR